MTSINVENRIVEIKTVQSNAIRILFEALKDILTDVNLQISNEGLKIISMDGSKQAVVNLKLEASKFEKFYCSKPIKAGINKPINRIERNSRCKSEFINLQIR